MIATHARWRIVAVALAAAGCQSHDGGSATAPPPKRSEPLTMHTEDAIPPLPDSAAYAVVRISRTVVYDDHPAAGGKLPDLDVGSGQIVLDFDRRTDQTRPVVRSYTAKIAVAARRDQSWILHLGDDYDLVVVTRGFKRVDGHAIEIDGDVKSNYQIALAEGQAPVGPNAFHLQRLEIGAPVAVLVLNAEAPGVIFRELMQLEVEAVTEAPRSLTTAAIDETRDAQVRRWDGWKPIRKRGLR